MKCPHCLTAFYTDEAEDHFVDYATEHHGTIVETDPVRGNQHRWMLQMVVCPTCHECIATIVILECIRNIIKQKVIVWPRHTGRPPVPPEVPDEFKRDYLEACLIIADSPKASAALSRRCLQQILRDKAQVQHPNNLAKAIEETVDKNDLPSDLAASLDAVRNIGNFAAHPNKGINTGEIVEVEPGEAEWCLDVIEMLFDHYFVWPAKIRARTMALNDKLIEMGKPTIPVPSGEDAGPA